MARRKRYRSRTGDPLVEGSSAGFARDLREWERMDDEVAQWLLGTTEALPRPLSPIREMRGTFMDTDRPIYPSGVVDPETGEIRELAKFEELVASKHALRLHQEALAASNIDPNGPLPPAPSIAEAPLSFVSGCVARKVRSEVLHALGVAGKRGVGRGMKQRKRSYVKC